MVRSGVGIGLVNALGIGLVNTLGAPDAPGNLSVRMRCTRHTHGCTSGSRLKCYVGGLTGCAAGARGVTVGVCSPVEGAGVLTGRFYMFEGGAILTRLESGAGELAGGVCGLQSVVCRLNDHVDCFIGLVGSARQCGGRFRWVGELRAIFGVPIGLGEGRSCTW